MHLKELTLQNSGPISRIDLTFGVKSDGNPKPNIFVGRNGAGKSIVLSYIADAIIEVAKKEFNNIVKADGMTSRYFRMTGALNGTLNTNFSFASLAFFDNGSRSSFTYVEKTGNLDRNSYIADPMISTRFPNLPNWETVSNTKDVAISNNNVIEQIFERQVLCYFPPSRHEMPYWLVEDAFESLSFYSPQRLSRQLDKEIIAESTWKTNRNWVMSVYVDSLSDVSRDSLGGLQVNNLDANRIDILRGSRLNVERVLSLIMQEQSLTLHMNYRNIGDRGRISVLKNGSPYLPSLGNLSTGQSILFNMFTTILRHAELQDLSKSQRTEEIEGIVIIDEIDSHIHSDLQYTVLPQLISIFPKIQFFISTHSPLFLLGIEKKLGSDNVAIIEMPDGVTITSERFSEFESSFKYYTDTKAYEDAFEAKLKMTHKPIVFTEGSTDVKYILTALEIFGRHDLINSIDIEQVGAIVDGKDIGGGDSGLDRLREFVRTNPNYLKRPTLVLYDCDTNTKDEVIGNLWVRGIPKFASKVENTKGIENVLSEDFFVLDDAGFLTRFGANRSEFWSLIQTKSKGYGGRGFAEEFHKVKFCNWVCSNYANPTVFADFRVIIDILDKFVSGDHT